MFILQCTVHPAVHCSPCSALFTLLKRQCSVPPAVYGSPSTIKLKCTLPLQCSLLPESCHNSHTPSDEVTKSGAGPGGVQCTVPQYHCALCHSAQCTVNSTSVPQLTVPQYHSEPYTVHSASVQYTLHSAVYILGVHTVP